MSAEMTGKTLIWVLLVAVAFAYSANAEARRLNAADGVPEFSVIDDKGAEFNYPRDANEVLLAVFLSPSKPQSVKALSDLEKMIGSIEASPNKLAVLIVLEDDPNAIAALKIKEDCPNAKIKKYIVIQRDYKLWGTFGVIAAPTVFLAGTDNKIMLIKAGYGYDFAPAIKSKLLMALGLTSEDTFSDAGGVKTARNDTASAKVTRHLKMAKMLQDKGKIDASLEQLAQAQILDPNDLQVALQIGRLNCARSKPDLALKALEGRVFTTPADQAASELIIGWANRLSGDFQAAQDHLLKATTLDPTSARAFFELGQVYEATSQNDLALKAYKKALSISLDRK